MPNNQLMKACLTFSLVLMLLFSLGVKAAQASYLTLSPTTQTVAQGDTLPVQVGINSGTDKVYTADIWLTFDASKLQLTDVSAAASPAFPFSLGDKNIDNTNGTVKLALNPAVSSSLDAQTASGPLLNLTFTAKATGTAAVAFSCTQGSLNDTNVVDPNTNDTVVCASNQAGSYTVTTGSTSTDTTTTSITTPTPVPSALPSTGVDGPTIALIIFGLAALGGAAYFAIL
jgi:LPXTG-motif cell wall-anchored protein